MWVQRQNRRERTLRRISTYFTYFHPVFRFSIRPAIQADQAEIVALVRSERLNPTNLDWRNFMVAVDQTGIIGAVQIRKHIDGSREVGSLVVRPEARGRGIASKLMDAITTRDSGRLLIVTGEAFAAHFARWSFRRIDPRDAPAAIRRNYRLGRLGGVLSLVSGQRPRRLVILDRADRLATQRDQGN